MRGRKRDVRERARAVGIALATGNVSEASRQTGVPRPTIVAWRDSSEFDELRRRSKDQVAEEWWAGVQHGFRVVVQEFDGPAPLRDKALAAAILYDKLALTRGEATIRTETRSLTDDYSDTEKQRLRDWIDSLVADPGSPAGDPVATGTEVR